MESTVTAPYAGEVTAVEVMPNAQVERRRPAAAHPGGRPASSDAVGARPLDLTGMEARPAPGTPPCERVFGSLRRYLLGYDLDPAIGETAPRRAAQARRDQPAGRRRTAPMRGRAPRPVRRGGRALPARGPRPSRTTRSPRPAPRSSCWPTCSGWTPTGRACPMPIATRLERRWPATASSGSSARRSWKPRSSGCSGPSAGSASWYPS